tara:strand:- start:579 stop:2471 length:1893 start_codon:yes stop_codon:yes gene_type:complete
MKSLKQKISNESGAILMSSTMGIFILLSIFAFYLARFASTENQTGGYYALDIKARNLALTGIEHGLHVYASSKSTESFTKKFNNGNYTVSFDDEKDEVGDQLSKIQYTMITSKAKISDTERKVRLLISTFPEAFSFSFYGNNINNQVFAEQGSSISGDMFFNGSVQENSIAIDGTTYNGSGSVGELLVIPPTFPELNETKYNNLLSDAELYQDSYTNYALKFDGNDDFIKINNSSDINIGSHHTNKTIEAWFKVDNKNITSRKQTIYEQGGTVRGLNIYVFGGSLYVGGWNEPESRWNPGTWLSTNLIQSNTWHHVALTLNGGNSVSNNAFKGYIDGIQFGSGKGSKLWSHGGDISIGRNRDTKFHSGDFNSARYFSGHIDEVRLWNITRTESEILSKKDTVLSGDEQGLTAYYSFQENSGTVANDGQTQSNNDGSIRNGSTWMPGPSLSKMSSSSFDNKTINLSSYDGSKLMSSSDIIISNSTINGPGYIVANGNITINSNSIVGGDIYIVCNGDLTITNTQLGTSLNSAVVIYSTGSTLYQNSTCYGLLISKGNSLQLNNMAHYGAVLNHSPSFTLLNNSSVTGSVVSKYSVDFQGSGSSINRGNLPKFSGKDIGLDPFVVPGSYLEF